MLGGIGVNELLIVLAIVLLIFGAGKLPGIGAGLGKAIQNFKKASKENPKEIKKDNNEENSEEKE